jgi:hypothetical protein
MPFRWCYGEEVPRHDTGFRASAGAQCPFAGATAATEIISVAGSAAVTLRLSSRPMRQPRPAEEVSSDGGAAPDRIAQGRCPRLELHASKGARAVLRGLDGSNAAQLPDPPEGARKNVDHAEEPPVSNRSR